MCRVVAFLAEAFAADARWASFPHAKSVQPMHTTFVPASVANAPTDRDEESPGGRLKSAATAIGRKLAVHQ
jgi:hypothetical protein